MDDDVWNNAVERHGKWAGSSVFYHCSGLSYSLEGLSADTYIFLIYIDLRKS